MSGQLVEILKKIPWGPLLVVYLAYLGYDYYGFTTDPQSPLLQKIAQIQSTKAENAKLDAKLKQAQDFYRTLDQKRNEIRALASQLAEMKSTLTEEMDVPAFMKMALTEATKVGLTVQSIKPAEYKKKEYYAEQAFDLKFRGVFVQFLVFLQRIADAKRVLTVNGIDITRKGPSVAKYVEVEGVVRIKAYKYLGSQADEIARTGGSMTLRQASGAAGKKAGAR